MAIVRTEAKKIGSSCKRSENEKGCTFRNGLLRKIKKK